ncbi:MAG: energy transducer TonB, partial [Bacteroidia bacterium]
MRFVILIVYLFLSELSFSQEDNALPYVTQEPRWDTPAYFPGGSDSLLKFFRLNTNLKLSSGSKNKTAYVLTAFTISRNGEIKNIRIVNGIPGQPELAGEAMRLLQICPLWVPARKKKKRVES